MTELLERIEHARSAVLDLGARLARTAAERGLPPAPAALDTCLDKLGDDEYRIAVVGEVKRGKSSFVNALVGSEILPTDVDVATSQVFCIRRGECESYRIRFADGSAQEIGRDDLPRYGSQVVEDVVGAPRLDQIIRWIEIDVPIRFLPEGITILDTPGLGGLYEIHAEITCEILHEVDAVIYVLESSRPLIEQDFQYLDRIIETTTSVFFVQTKIDLHRTAEWGKVKARNEKVLNERYEERLGACRIWPVSSTLLLMAAANGDEDFEIASKHRELAPALKRFLFRVSGFDRAARALLVATDFYETVLAQLNRRHRSLIDATKEDRQRLQERLTGLKTDFDQSWGPQGEKRFELEEDIKKLCVVGKSHFQQCVSPSGTLLASLQQEVEETSSFEELKSLVDQIPDTVSSRAMATWRQVTEQSWKQTVELLLPFIKEAASLTAPEMDGKPIATSQASRPQLDREWYTKLAGARRDFFNGTFLGGASVGGFGAIILGLSTPVIAPLAGIAALAGGVLCLVRGTRVIDKRQLQDSKREVSLFAGRVVQETSRYFFSVDAHATKLCLVDEYFSKLKKNAEKDVQQIARNANQNLQEEIATLKKDVEKTHEERLQEAKSVQETCSAWSTAERDIRGLQRCLQELDSDLTSP